MLVFFWPFYWFNCQLQKFSHLYLYMNVCKMSKVNHNIFFLLFVIKILFLRKQIHFHFELQNRKNCLPKKKEWICSQIDSHLDDQQRLFHWNQIKIKLLICFSFFFLFFSVLWLSSSTHLAIWNHDMQMLILFKNFPFSFQFVFFWLDLKLINLCPFKNHFCCCCCCFHYTTRSTRSQYVCVCVSLVSGDCRSKSVSISLDWNSCVCVCVPYTIRFFFNVTILWI